MRSAALLLSGWVFLISPAVSAQPLRIPPRVRQALTQAAEANHISVRLLTALCFKESSFRSWVVHHHDGDGDSYGLCQIQEDTARDMGFKGEVKELLNPYVNAYYAAKYLKHQLNRYDGDWLKALSAYNSGWARQDLINRQYIHDILLMAVTL